MRQKITASLILFFVFVLLLHNMQYIPVPWFDEGWALSLARNWVVLGHYGHLRLGEPVPSTVLNTGFPAIFPIALSFQLFGIGIWQGRLPIIFFALGVCLLLYHLAQRLYGRRIAALSLMIALFLPMGPDLHIIPMGKQALGEVPSLFYLLAGYSLLFSFWNKVTPSILAAPFLFSLALLTKPQILPFFLLSLLVPISWLIQKRNWPVTRYLSVSLVLSVTFSLLFWSATGLLSIASPISDSPVFSGDSYAMIRNADVLLTYVLVLNPEFRGAFLLRALMATLGLPVILGIIYIWITKVRGMWQQGTADAKSIWILILWTFVFSWLVWFFFFSIGFSRYLFPGFLVGTIFVAKAFNHILLDFNPLAILQRLAQDLHYRRVNLNSLGILVATAFTIFWVIITINLSYRPLFSQSDHAYARILNFLNRETPPSAIVETYDSELFFLLERDYHYPPDEVQHLMNRNHHFGEELIIDYDPTAVGIDYLVISPMWPLYNNLLNEADFELVLTYGGYRVYRYNPASSRVGQ
jgi:hypothetical protein